MEKDNDLVLPTKVSDLFDLLNNLFPEKTPDIEHSHKDIYFAAGPRDVVRFLHYLTDRAVNEAIF